MEPFRKNDVVRLDIERFGSAGEGVAHLPGGMVVFAPYNLQIRQPPSKFSEFSHFAGHI